MQNRQYLTEPAQSHPANDGVVRENWDVEGKAGEEERVAECD
jgi:hypothetical protein